MASKTLKMFWASPEPPCMPCLCEDVGKRSGSTCVSRYLVHALLCLSGSDPTLCIYRASDIKHGANPAQIQLLAHEVPEQTRVHSALLTSAGSIPHFSLLLLEPLQHHAKICKQKKPLIRSDALTGRHAYPIYTCKPASTGTWQSPRSRCVAPAAASDRWCPKQAG